MIHNSTLYSTRSRVQQKAKPPNPEPKKISNPSSNSSDRIQEFVINFSQFLNRFAETMGQAEKLMNQIMELKFTAKSLQRQARKCEKDEKSEKLKVKKAIEKGNMDGARIYAENAIRKRSEQMNYLRLSSRLDAVVARLDTQAKMTTISKSMGSIVKSLESTLATGNLQKMSETMDQFERQFVNMEVQAEFMESSMAGSTSLSTPEGEVNSLMQQVADDYGLEVSVGLPQPAGHAVATKNTEKVEEDDLSRRLADLKARG
ncbi:hypothetical protein L6452_07768 [Arctium lappa]|uniref:Uncharacterized protein n=1 Tax=Arctium lappa TaxID=4217 RepID=A0ACB9EME5_ARCLA|nr:hypothetical protein L6452_07768 [Arctium lappa]